MQDTTTAAVTEDVVDPPHIEAEEDPLSLPPYGTEVFIGGIPIEATEEQLMAFSGQVGEVFRVNLAKDQHKPDQHRGFGFVMYTTQESAVKALDQLDEKELPGHPGSKARVRPSQSKHKLYVGGIPPGMSKQTLQTSLESKVKGIQAVDLALNKDNPDQNRGFAFLEFYNAACAQVAKKIMSGSDFKIDGFGPFQVDFAASTDRDSVQLANKNLFVGNLPEKTNEDQLKEVFSKYGVVDKVTFPRLREGETTHRFAFVAMTERAAALKAVEDQEKPKLGETELLVRYGRDHQQHQGGRGGGRVSGRGRGGGFDGYGGPYGGNMMMGNMLPVFPVQLPNGQMGYMVQGMMGGGSSSSTYGGGGRGRGRRGGGGGRGGGGPRYQPY